MPTVPDIPRQQVEQRALPGVRLSGDVSPDAFGAAIGRGTQDIAQALDRRDTLRQRVVAEEREKAERTAFFNVDSQLAAWDNEEQIKAQSKRGSEAFALPDDLRQRRAAKVAEIEKGITSERVRESFRQSAQARGLDVDAQVQRHVAREREDYRIATVKAAVETSQNVAWTKAGDGFAVDTEVARQRLILREGLQGSPKEEVDLALAESASRTYAGAISALIDQNRPDLAKQEMARVGAFILPGQAKGLRDALAVADERATSQRLVDDLLARDANGNLPPLDVALAQVRERVGDNAALREEAERRLVSMHGLHQRADQERDDTLFRKSYDTFTDPANTRGLDAIPATEWSRLSPERREALKAIDARRDRGVELPKNGPAYLRLLRDAGRDPQAFGKLNLLDRAHEVAPSDLAELQKLQNDLIKTGGAGGEATQKLLAGVRTKDEAVTSLLKARMPNLTGKDADPALADAFYSALDAKVIAQQQATGKPATPAEVRELAEVLLIEHTVTRPGSWFGSLGTTDEVSVRAFQLTPEEAARSGAAAQPDRYAGQGEDAADGVDQFEAAVTDLRRDAVLGATYDRLEPEDRAQFDRILAQPSTPKNDRLRVEALRRLRALAGR